MPKNIVDRVFPPDPDNFAEAEAYLAARRRGADSPYFARDALRESEVFERAVMNQQLNGGELYDPLTGMHLELIERDGLWLYVSPDNPDFGFEPVEEIELPSFS